MAQFNKNEQDFLNQERTLFEVNMIANKNGNVVTVDNPFPVSLGSSNITINGDITIPGIVTVTSTPDNPIHSHIIEVGTSSTLTTPYMPIGVGLTNLNLSYLPVGISSLLNIVSVSNTSFYVTGIGNTVNVSGTVNIGAGNTIDVNVLNPVTTVTVGGTVSIGNTVDVSGTVNIGTMPEVEIKNDTGNPIPISKNTTVNSNSNHIFVK